MGLLQSPNSELQGQGKSFISVLPGSWYISELGSEGEPCRTEQWHVELVRRRILA